VAAILDTCTTLAAFCSVDDEEDLLTVAVETASANADELPLDCAVGLTIVVIGATIEVPLICMILPSNSRVNLLSTSIGRISLFV
jgi:hypothetical protein